MKEFIVDCSDNVENIQEVYDWLIKTRDYDTFSYTNVHAKWKVIICNKESGQSKENTVQEALERFPNHPVYTFEQFKNKYLEKKDEIMLKEKGMKELMLDVLEKTYSNSVLRERTVPLFMSPPGFGKTTIIKEFALEKSVKLLKMTLSQRMPNEVVGMMMPNVKSGKLEVFDSYELESLNDGDILFIDEVFNGTLKQTLDAFLNLLEDRHLPSGKKMANIMIVGASNPQGLINLTPQIKERFIRYDLNFCAEEYQAYLKDKYGIPESISANFCTLIKKEKFESENWNYHSPRSIEKAINQIGCELQSPLDDILLPYLIAPLTATCDLPSCNVKKGEEFEFLPILKKVVKARNNIVSKKDVLKKLVKIEN